MPAGTYRPATSLDLPSGQKKQSSTANTPRMITPMGKKGKIPRGTKVQTHRFPSHCPGDGWSSAVSACDATPVIIDRRGDAGIGTDGRADTEDPT